jgi:hypothetical protein
VENIQDRSDIQSSGELMDEQEHGEKAYDTNSSDNMSWLQGHATLTFGIIFYIGAKRTPEPWAWAAAGRPQSHTLTMPTCNGNSAWLPNFSNTRSKNTGRDRVRRAASSIFTASKWIDHS